MKYFSITKEKIAYMECIIQSTTFYSFYLFLSILLCNADSVLVSDSSRIRIYLNFELYSNVQIILNVRIYIQLVKECVFSICSWKMVSSDDVEKIWKRKEISLLLLLSFLNPKISFFTGTGRWGGGVCAERDVTQEGCREQTWQTVMVGVGGSKKAIIAWRNYWIAPLVQW